MVPQHRTMVARKYLTALLGRLLRTRVECLRYGGDNVVGHRVRLALEHVANVTVTVRLLAANDAKVIGIFVTLGTTGHITKMFVQQYLLAIGRYETHFRFANEKDHRTILFDRRNGADRCGPITLFRYPVGIGTRQNIYLHSNEFTKEKKNSKKGKDSSKKRTGKTISNKKKTTKQHNLLVRCGLNNFRQWRLHCGCNRIALITVKQRPRKSI